MLAFVLFLLFDFWTGQTPVCVCPLRLLFVFLMESAVLADCDSSHPFMHFSQGISLQKHCFAQIIRSEIPGFSRKKAHWPLFRSVTFYDYKMRNRKCQVFSKYRRSTAAGPAAGIASGLAAGITSGLTAVFRHRIGIAAFFHFFLASFSSNGKVLLIEKRLRKRNWYLNENHLDNNCIDHPGVSGNCHRIWSVLSIPMITKRPRGRAAGTVSQVFPVIKRI